MSQQLELHIGTALPTLLAMTWDHSWVRPGSTLYKQGCFPIYTKQALKNESHSRLVWDAEVVLTPLMAKVLIAIIINCLIYS